jgi:hypothetical protein
VSLEISIFLLHFIFLTAVIFDRHFRSNYIEESRMVGVPDPGAVAAAACFQTAAEVMR